MIKKEELSLFKLQDYHVLEAKLLMFKSQHPIALDGQAQEACVNGNIVDLVNNLLNENGEDPIWRCLSDKTLLIALTHYLKLEGVFIRNAQLPLNEQGNINVNSDAVTKGGGWNQEDFLILQLFSYIKILGETKLQSPAVLKNFEDKLHMFRQKAGVKEGGGVSALEVLLVREIYLLLHAYLIRLAYSSILKDSNIKDYNERLAILFEQYLERINPLLDQNWTFCIPCGSNEHAVYLMLSKVRNEYHIRIDDSSRREVTTFVTPRDKVKAQGGLINYLVQVSLADAMHYHPAMQILYNQEPRGNKKLKFDHMIEYKNNGYQARELSKTDHCVYQGFLINRYYRFEALGVVDILYYLIQEELGCVNLQKEYHKPTPVDWFVVQQRSSYQRINLTEFEKFRPTPKLRFFSTSVLKIDTTQSRKAPIVHPATQFPIKEYDFTRSFDEYKIRTIVGLINQSKYQDALNDINKFSKSKMDWKLNLLKGLCLSNLLHHREALECYSLSEDKIKARKFCKNLFLFLRAQVFLFDALYVDCVKKYFVDTNGRLYLTENGHQKFYLLKDRTEKLDSAISFFSSVYESLKTDVDSEKLLSGVQVIDNFSIEWVEFYMLYSEYIKDMLLLIDHYKGSDDDENILIIGSIFMKLDKVESLLENVKIYRSNDSKLIDALMSFLTELKFSDRVDGRLKRNKEKPDAYQRFILSYEYPVLYNCEVIRESILFALVNYRKNSQKVVERYRNDTKLQIVFNEIFIKIWTPYANDYFLCRQYNELKSLIKMYYSGILGFRCGNDIFVFFQTLLAYIKGFELLEIREPSYHENAIDRGIFEYVEVYGFTFSEGWGAWVKGHESHEFISKYLIIKFRSESDEREVEILKCWQDFNLLDISSHLKNNIRSELNAIAHEVSHEDTAAASIDILHN